MGQVGSLLALVIAIDPVMDSVVASLGISLGFTCDRRGIAGRAPACDPLRTLVAVDVDDL